MPFGAVFSKRVVCLLFLLLILLSIVYRYPLVDHERNQSDSYFIHGLSSDICSDGHASWTLHPLSYFGLYPLSYPSGMPFLYSELSCMTGLSIEGCILILGIILSTISCAIVFCLIRRFVVGDGYVLLGTFLTMSGARFIDSTYWVGSGRAPVAIFILITILVVIMASSKKNTALYCIGGVLLLFSFALHHMAILILLFGIAYILVTIGKTISHFESGGSSRLLIGYYLCVGSLILFVGFVATNFFYMIARASLETTSLFSLDSPEASIVLNTGVAFTQQIGFIFPVAVVGAPFVAIAGWRKAHKNESLLVLFFCMVFVPFIGYVIYVSLLLAPFLAIIGVLWIQGRLGVPKKGRALKLTVIFLVISSLLLPVWTIDRWNSISYRSGDRVEVEDQVFSDAIYLSKLKEEGNVTSNVDSLQVFLIPISGTPFIGGGLSAVLYGEINQTDIENNIVRSKVGFPRNMYTWYDYVGPIVGQFFRRNLMIYGVGYLYTSHSIDRDYLTYNSHLIVAIDNNWPRHFVSSVETTNSVLADELRTSTSLAASIPADAIEAFQSYCVYSSSRTSYYFVQLPIATPS